MRSDRDIVILGYDVDILIGCMRDDIDLRIADEKIRDDIAHCELHRRHGRRAANGTGRFTKPMAHGGLSQFGLTQHQHCVAIELAASVGHSEPSRRAIEESDAEGILKLLDAMAQRRFWNS